MGESDDLELPAICSFDVLAAAGVENNHQNGQQPCHRRDSSSDGDVNRTA